jgi:Holliday junction resolvase-like predicted endonuclease
MKIPEIEKKFVEMNNDEERNVANLLIDLGLTFVDSNVRLGDSQKEYLGEIDSLFTSNSYLFLIEVSKEKSSNEKKFTFFTKWADKDILEIITNQYKLQLEKVIRVYFDLSTKTPENRSPYLQILTRPDKMNKVAYRDDYENFWNFTKKTKSGTGNLFLDWIDSS